jgi:hypothetical protein
MQGQGDPLPGTGLTDKLPGLPAMTGPAGPAISSFTLREHFVA